MFRTYIETTETNRTVSKQTETNRNNPEFCGDLLLQLFNNLRIKFLVQRHREAFPEKPSKEDGEEAWNMRPRPIVNNRGFISPCRRRNHSLDLSTWRPWRCYVSWLGPDCEARVGLGLNSEIVLFNKIHLNPYPGRRQIQTDQHLQCWSTRTFSTRQT